MVLEVVGCKGTSNRAKRGSGEIVILYAELRVEKIWDQNLTSLGQDQNIWE